MENIVTILSPILITAITQGVKRIQMIPINDGQKMRIRTFVGIASLVIGLIEAYLNGSLESSPLVPIVANTAINYIGATVTYLGWKSVRPITE